MAWNLSLATANGRLNPWLVAVAVVIPTFMEVLDTTIANVALRYIAGGFSAPSTDSEWVITSYLAANAIVFRSRAGCRELGRRNYFLISIAVFTLASSCAAWPPASKCSSRPACCRASPAADCNPPVRAMLLDASRQRNKARQ